MKFTLKTEKGSEFELDSQLINSLDLEIDGRCYLISIKEYAT